MTAACTSIRALMPSEPSGGVEGRRTIRITGQPVPARRRRAAPVPIASSRPDRLALWAVMLGFFLVFMAAATARADEPDPVAGCAIHCLR